MAEIRAIAPPGRYRPLSESRLEEIHEAALRVLEEVGIGLQGNALTARLAAGGLNVSEAGRVRFPRPVVEAALDAAPHELLLYARRPGADLRLDGGRCYLGLDGCAAELIDPRDGARRGSTAADVGWITALADALEPIAFVWQPVAARDAPPATASLHELRAQLRATDKHIQMMTAADPANAAGVVEIARIVAGGAEALRSRPFISSFQCSISPLVYAPEAIEAACVFAEAGVPAGFVVMPITCASAPAARVGTLVQAHAELLAGIALLETLVPGAPTFYGSCATVMDLHTGAPACGGPEDLYYQAATAQLAHRLGLPACVGTFATGAKRPDWQAGLENGLSGLVSLLAGAELLAGAGLLHAARVFSAEQLLLDAEIFELLAALPEPAAEAPAAAWVDVLAEIGPGGHFLEHDSTLAGLEALWRPRLFDRRSWEEAEERGWPGPLEAARARLQEMLDAVPPCKLDGALDERVGEVIERFERRASVGHA